MGVPQQFIGIHCLISIAALAIHVEIRCQFHTPGQADICVTTILEIPCSQIIRGLQTVLSAGIRRTTVEREAEHPDAITKPQFGREIIGMRHIAVGHSRTVQVDITYAMIVASVDGAAHVPAIQRVESDIKRHTKVGTPVTVDILWFRYTSTSGFIIGHDITYRVAGNLPSTIGSETPVSLILGHSESHTVGHELLLSLHLEVKAEVRVERRFQTCVTRRDVQRVCIVVNFEQLGNLWLLRLSAELNLEIGLLIEAVTHIQRRRYISDSSDSIHRTSQILLDEVRLLWLDVNTDIHIQFLAHHT